MPAWGVCADRTACICIHAGLSACVFANGCSWGCVRMCLPGCMCACACTCVQSGLRACLCIRAIGLCECVCLQLGCAHARACVCVVGLCTCACVCVSPWERAGVRHSLTPALFLVWWGCGRDENPSGPALLSSPQHSGPLSPGQPLRKYSLPSRTFYQGH